MAAKKTKAGGSSEKLLRAEVLTRTVTRATEKQRMLKQLICTDAPEQALRYCGYRQIAGVDEVGRSGWRPWQRLGSKIQSR